MYIFSLTGNQSFYHLFQDRILFQIRQIVNNLCRRISQPHGCNISGKDIRFSTLQKFCCGFCGAHITVLEGFLHFRVSFPVCCFFSGDLFYRLHQYFFLFLCVHVKILLVFHSVTVQSLAGYSLLNSHFSLCFVSLTVHPVPS